MEIKKFFGNKKNLTVTFILPVIILAMAAGAILFYLGINPFGLGGGKKEGINGQKLILEESSKMSKSQSDEWWLNSGGVMLENPEGFSTNIGALPKDNYWRNLYAKTNPRDTDGGYFPQNIFRLVTKNQWKNFSETLYFSVEKNNLSESKYRNESNGILLFNRYQDGDNLYYAGLRVDGQAVIKKKIEGKYYTLTEKQIFGSAKNYDKDNNPNLLPLNQWLGIKSELVNSGENTVNIKLFIDKEQKGDWQLVLETEDRDDKYGNAPFLEKGYAGIRTDFMNVIFKNYSVKEVN